MYQTSYLIIGAIDKLPYNSAVNLQEHTGISQVNRPNLKSVPISLFQHSQVCQ